MIHLDAAATAPTDPAIAERVREWLSMPANASSVHRAGQKARALLEEARERIAAALDAEPSWVLFTSGASEANNLAIRGLADARRGSPLDALSSPLEHSCVRETVAALAAAGRLEPHRMRVCEAGRAQVPLECPRAELLCLLAVQNETGVVQELESARLLRSTQPSLRWLCDATQAIGRVPFSMRAVGADFVTFSSHKLGGPPGVGALVSPRLSELVPQITGGPQEHERRAGTQPVALCAGFALAVDRAVAERERAATALLALEERLLARLAALGVEFRRNGGEPRAPGFLNLSFPKLTGADLVIALDARGFATSAGAACATGVMESSPALRAMYPNDAERALGAVRITPSPQTPIDAMDSLAEALGEIAQGAIGAGKRSSP